MRRVVLATGNAGKLAEMRAILASRDLEVIPQSEFGITPPVEDGATFIANALIKARHAAAHSGLPAIADDSGLEVDALGGRPGLHSARYAGPAAAARDNNELLLAELAGIPERQRGARFRCAMVFVRDAADPLPVITEAAWEGRIGREPRGAGGFGFDPLFIVEGDSRTAAEMPAEEKNRVSHRGQALLALAARMRESGW
ncbi:MAG: Ham1 protein [Steroidobacteraceae bacterium]|nr:Ham1 protein [Steroidobacteraceae bacterium]MBM2853618.1 Ham1 protein [Steroidobacteraceae bacterium]